MHKCIFIVAAKELKEIFRDKSTFIILSLPIIFFPLLILGLNYIAKETPTQLSIAVINNNDAAYSVFEDFTKSESGSYLNVVLDESPIELLQNNDVDCVIRFDSDKIYFVYNSSSYNSISSATKAGETFESFFLAQLSSETGKVCEFALIDENGDAHSATSTVYNLMVPILLIISITQGTSSFANDLFAGERERKTIELLFLSGAKRCCIYLGKTLSLIAISFINVIISLSSYLISFYFSNDGLSQFPCFSGANAPINTTVIIFSMLCLSAIYSLITITVSMTAKNMKNAQILNEIIMALPVVAIIVSVMGNFNSKFLAFVPIVNTAICFKDALMNTLNTSSLFISSVINAVFVFAVVIIGIRYINSEKAIV